MSDGFDEVYVDTRRQLRGVAESLIAGPQYRTAGTIRLAVRPGGFAGVAIPLAVHGTELVWSNGAAALAGPNVLPDQHPVLWPEHFDVAATADEVNYGVSAGDDYHQTPYAYIGPWTARTGPFWNAPFGALYPLDPAHDVDALTAHIADFFEQGRRQS